MSSPSRRFDPIGGLVAAAQVASAQDASTQDGAARDTAVQATVPKTAAAEDTAPRVTVVIPIWNSARWLPTCLRSLTDQTFDDFRVVIVDNGSTDGATAALEERTPAVEVIRLPTNRGFAAAVNTGIQRSASEYVAVLNVDTVVHQEWLEQLVETLDPVADRVAAVTPLMIQMNRSARVDNAGDAFSWYGSATKIGHGEPAERYFKRREVVAVSAGAALYRRQFFEQVGLFDEVFESYLEDVDLSLRGRLLGYCYTYQPRAIVAHAGHGSALPRGRYVSLVTHNRLLVMLKNFPGRGLLRHAAQVLWGQFYYFVVYRHPLRSIAGYLSFLRSLGHALRSRRQLRSGAVLPDDMWKTLISNDLGEPALRDLLRRRLRNRKR